MDAFNIEIIGYSYTKKHNSVMPYYDGLNQVLERIKKETNAKIMVMVPFVLDYDDEMRRHIREELPSIQKIVYELADEYADVCIPLDKYFAEALPNQPAALYYSPDGVHPNPKGADFIARHYLEAVKPLINEIIAE